MKLEIIENRSEELAINLTSLWKESVLATHDFLSLDVIEAIEPCLTPYIKKIPSLIVAFVNETPVGFLGIEDKIEMLFISPDYIGQGIGKQLMTCAIKNFQVNEVTVNEQNPKAKGFYEHLGFTVYKRTECDEQGRPYPILYMRK